MPIIKWIQYALPHHCLSRIIGRFTRCRWKWVKHWQFRKFFRDYTIDPTEIASCDPNDYEHFNAFFTRQLLPGKRPVTPHGIASPVDGTVMACGQLTHNQLVQIKTSYYSLEELLAEHNVSTFLNGHFITLYLSPENYHRIHAPIDGELMESLFIPGRLFSVNPKVIQLIPGIFTRNERLICYFTTKQGPMAVIFVGALLVGSIVTSWKGRVSGRQRKSAEKISFRRGDELGHFEFGSTIILLFPPEQIKIEVQEGQKVKYGERIADFLH